MSADTVTVYWRPMCGYCEVLKQDLDEAEIPYEAVDIWADRSSANIVTQATGGDEIVPTVRVGDLFLVNPSAEQVRAVREG